MEENKDTPIRVEAKLQQGSDYNFIQEKIKDRPINKKKLARKMAKTVGTAILFGLVACITFILLEPVFSRMVNPNNEIQLKKVAFNTDETTDEPDDITVIISDQPIDDIGVDKSYEEMPIEDMSLTDADMPTTIGTPAGGGNQVIKETKELELEDYRLLYRQLFILSQEVEKSVVNLSEKPSISPTGEIDMKVSSTSGLIIGDNGYELLIIADSSKVGNVETLTAKFNNNDTADAVVKRIDAGTKLGVYAVKLDDLESETITECPSATLGSSVSTTFNGSPVVTVGNPLSSANSVCFGIVTSSDGELEKPDAHYQIVTTDIYADKMANGFLINVRGQIVGVITSDGHQDGLQNLIYAYGISSVKGLIEDLSNDIATSYIGLYVMDVSDEAKSELGVPVGAYVTKIDNNSPAMRVGILAGDVVVAVNDNAISSVNGYSQYLRKIEPGSEITLTLMRYSAGAYKEVMVKVTSEEK